MKLEGIDQGREFDFGKTSLDYGKYRDIYPESLFARLYAAGIGRPGQSLLDLGTGTGVLPRAMVKYGAKFTGIDISPEQIEQAILLSRERGIGIDYFVRPAEETGLPSGSYDAITAVQCFIYFNQERVLPEIARLLKPGGLFARVSMIWLPEEDEIARMTEALVLQHNPQWTGAHFVRAKPGIPDWSVPWFEVKEILDFDERIPFTYETWRGRIRACRGVAAALPSVAVEQFDREHEAALKTWTRESFTILHQVMVHVFQNKP
jgi:SAM-dependent methyltransferase